MPFAHPLDGGRAAVAHRSVEETAAGLGGGGDAYRKLMTPLVRHADAIAAEVLGPLRSIPPTPWPWPGSACRA